MSGSDLAPLNRVFHRLALVDTSQKLSAVLDKLLPRLLRRIGDNHTGSSPEKAAIHAKLVEMISHVLKRVRDDSDVKLPCVDLLQLLVVCDDETATTAPSPTQNATQEAAGTGDPADDLPPIPQAAPNIHPLTFNLTLTFLGIGIQREESPIALLPALLALLEGTTLTDQQDQLVSHLILTAIEQQTPSETQHALLLRTARCIAGPKTLDLFLDVLLYQPGPNPNLPSPGLSSSSQSRLLSNTTWKQRWVSMKQIILDMISPRNHLLSPAPSIVLLVVASNAPQHDVAQRSQLYLRQLLEASHTNNDNTNDASRSSSCSDDLLRLCMASNESSAAHRRRPLGPTAAAAVMEFCATQATTMQQHTPLAVTVAVARLQEDDATLKRAAAQLLRAVATTVDSVDLLTQCRDAAHSILDTASSSSAVVVVRDAAYGILATVARQLPITIAVDSTVATAQLLFRCVAQEQESLRPRAVAALDAVAAALQRYVMKDGSNTKSTAASTQNNPWSQPAVQESKEDQQHEQLGRSLAPLLWTAAQSYQPPSSRAAAAHWADQVLRHIALSSACHLLCYLAGDASTETVAREALLESSSRPRRVTPSFGDMTRRLLAPEAAARVKRYADCSPTGQACCIRFLWTCLVEDMYASEQDESSLDLYVATVTDTLATATALHVDLLDACAECLLSTLTLSAYARSQVLERLAWIESLARTVDSSRARRQLAGVYGTLVEHHAVVVAAGTEWIQELQLGTALASCAEVIVSKIDQSTSQPLGHVHGALFLSAHIIRAVRVQGNGVDAAASSPEWSSITAIIRSAGKGLLDKDQAIVHACADSLAIAYSCDDADAPILPTKLLDSSASVLSTITQALQRFGHSDTVDPMKTAKIVQTAGACLAATTTASSDATIGSQRIACINALYNILGSAANKKDEDISILVGEALSQFADGYSPRDAVWSNPGEWPEAFCEDFAGQLPPHENVLFVIIRRLFASSSPQVRTACAPALLAVVARGISKLRLAPTEPRSLARSLTKNLGSVQGVFISLLSDSRSTHFSRESCCLGLAACRGLSELASSWSSVQNSISSEGLNAKLLQVFGQTTKYGDSMYIETPEQAAARRAANAEPNGGQTTQGDVNADREVGVGGAAGVSEASLGAFREMAAASLALERPDILYALMFLSVSHPFWFLEENKLRYSSSMLLGDEISMGGETGSLELKQALRPHLGKLVPRLLRACHDPNKQTREQMKALWGGLTGGGAEGRAVITEHFISTIDTLFEDASNRLWRARAGACGALSEVIVGREWNDFGGGAPVLNEDDFQESSTNRKSGGAWRILRLWRIATRGLDDVHGSVQQNGETLARSVRALTIRLCDPNMDSKSAGEKRTREEEAQRERAAASAAATCLWWLFRHGLTHKSQVVAGICISTIVGIVKVVRARVIDPSLPDLIRSLIIAMSGLEPAALNYLQFHAENQEGLEALRLRMAQSGPLADALNKCLELLPSAKPETQERVAFSLNAALRQSAGFASRAAVADAVSSLCSTCPTVFSMSKTSTIQLLRAIYFASERERSSSAKAKMVHALGNLAGLCPGSSVRSLAMKACNRYTRATGNSFDPLSRKTAASTLRAIAVRASGHFKDGGKADIWRRKVLPVAFLGRKDDDDKVAAAWTEVWEEGGSSVLASTPPVGVLVFGTTLEEQILTSLVEECVFALQDVSWSRRVAGAVAIEDLVSKGILAPLPPIRSSVASEDRPSRARKRAESSQTALSECIRLLKKPRLWNGKARVITAATKLASVWVYSAETDYKVFFGCEKTIDSCTWLPVSLAVEERHMGDLLTGDDWFRDSGNTEDDENGDGNKSPEPTLDENMPTTGDTVMNFDECPNALEEETNTAMEESLDEAIPASYAGLCRFLCAQVTADRNTADTTGHLLPYKTACLRGFKHLATNLPIENTETRFSVYKQVVRSLTTLVVPEPNENDDSTTTEYSATPPVVVAGALDCVTACCWKDMDGAVVQDMITLCTKAPQHRAWTIHAATCNGLSALARVCSHEAIRQYCWSTLVDVAAEAQKDRKYWRVRLAGLEILECLITRAAEKKNELNLVLESLLPQKERILTIARCGLNDSESKVKELSSRILLDMTWWP